MESLGGIKDIEKFCGVGGDEDRLLSGDGLVYKLVGELYAVPVWLGWLYAVPVWLGWVFWVEFVGWLYAVPVWLGWLYVWFGLSFWF